MQETRFNKKAYKKFGGNYAEYKWNKNYDGRESKEIDSPVCNPHFFQPAFPAAIQYCGLADCWAISRERTAGSSQFLGTAYFFAGQFFYRDSGGCWRCDLALFRGEG